MWSSVRPPGHAVDFDSNFAFGAGAWGLGSTRLSVRSRAPRACTCTCAPRARRPGGLAGRRTRQSAARGSGSRRAVGALIARCPLRVMALIDGVNCALPHMRHMPHAALRVYMVAVGGSWTGVESG